MAFASDSPPVTGLQRAGVIVLGANGRLGRMLQHGWTDGITALWQVRDPHHRDASVVFDPLGPWPDLPPCDVVVCLAGVIHGCEAALGLNTALAIAAIERGAELGAKRVFLASTAAVYGRSDAALPETAVLSPLSAYGAAKVLMEEKGQLRAAALGLPLTVLRIGNVAGADTLLGQASAEQASAEQASAEQAGAGQITLDRFADGQGPRRSYIGPDGFAAVIQALVHLAARGNTLPSCLNLALPDAVAMAQLLHAAQIPFAWRPAPATSLPVVHMDVTRLAQLVPLPSAKPDAIVQDWRNYIRGTG